MYSVSKNHFDNKKVRHSCTAGPLICCHLDPIGGHLGYLIFSFFGAYTILSLLLSERYLMVVPSAAILVFFIMVINVVGAARLIGIYLLLELYSVFFRVPAFTAGNKS